MRYKLLRRSGLRVSEMGLGTSERFLGEFISSDRGHFVVATTYTLFNREGTYP
jgi:aryl-alcohol dehydrogenase-like predicted oxidoreductase